MVVKMASRGHLKAKLTNRLLVDITRVPNLQQVGLIQNNFYGGDYREAGCRRVWFKFRL